MQFYLYHLYLKRIADRWIFYFKVSTDIPVREGMMMEAETHRGHCLTSDPMFGMTGYHKLSKVYN